MTDVTDQNKKIILLAEDDLFIRELYTHIFEDAGYTVLAAEDGEKAVAMAQGPTIGVMLLDMMMPKMDGLAVLKKLKEDPETNYIPIIMLTNMGEEVVVKEAMESGAIGYLIKMNFTPKQLVEKIQDFLNTGKLQI